MRWDYAVVRLAGSYTARQTELDDWGELGYELVSVTADGAEKVAYLKRPIAQEATPWPTRP